MTRSVSDGVFDHIRHVEASPSTCLRPFLGHEEKPRDKRCRSWVAPLFITAREKRGQVRMASGGEIEIPIYRVKYLTG
jgi:hypothetical protein